MDFIAASATFACFLLAIAFSIRLRAALPAARRRHRRQQWHRQGPHLLSMPPLVHRTVALMLPPVDR